MTTTDFEDSDWMKTEAEFECTDPEAFFYEKELNFEASFSLTCEKNLIFGGKFPYWQIPGTNYPEKTEVICAHTKKCYNFAEFDPAIKKYGLTDTFDNYHFEKDAKYQYYCSNEIRGKRKILYSDLSLFTKGHARFKTPENRDDSVLHFVDNSSIPLHKKFYIRVYPEGPVKLTFSKTKDQLNKTLTFNIGMDETIVEEFGCNFDFSLNEPSQKVNLKSINDIEITITDTKINFEDKIIINGSFEELKFIGFDSELPASWIVQKSISLLKLRYLLFFFVLSFTCIHDCYR